jgi:hypothetical protein
MAIPHEPQPVKLIIGMLSSEVSLFDEVKKALIESFGEIDLETGLIDFSHTDYYNDELGYGIKRKFASFASLIQPGEIVKIKHDVTDIEVRYQKEDKRRRINLDPGYITLSKLVLVTYKDYSHRVYIGDKVYGEATLKFVDGTFQPFEYTYPDYRSREYIDFFNKVREVYKSQLRNLR